MERKRVFCKIYDTACEKYRRYLSRYSKSIADILGSYTDIAILTTLEVTSHMQSECHWEYNIRVSNRSEGQIFRSFQETFDENSVEFEVFETVNFNFNKKKYVSTGAIRCLSQCHPTITNSYSYS